MKHELTPEELEARFAQRAKELTKKCRYYHGEVECPEGKVSNPLFWDYERIWVNDLARSYRNAEGWRQDYKFLNLGNFAEEVGVPTSLVGLFVNRYMHWVGGYMPVENETEAFKRWFRRKYLNESEKE